MSVLKRVMAVRTGGGTERCHGVRHIGSYSNASHTWGVLALLFVLWPKDFARIAPYALFHDVPEAWVGDVPAPVKFYCPEVKEAFHGMERRIFEHLQLPNEQDLAPEDKAKLKACDRLELYIWALEQVHMGNAHADCITRELDGFFGREPLPSPAYELYAELCCGGSVNHDVSSVIRELME